MIPSEHRKAIFYTLFEMSKHTYSYNSSSSNKTIQDDRKKNNKIIHTQTRHLTSPVLISTTIPSAWGITRISENIIAASKGNLSKGCRVTLQDRAGVWHMVKKSHFARSSRNSAEITYNSMGENTK